MEKKLFKISGRFKQNGRWSGLKEDFVGHFLLDKETNIFIGYMEEQYASRYNNERYITGLFFEDNGIVKLTFMKFVNEWNLAPIMYAFFDISKKGYWSAFNPICGFDSPNGEATVVLEEIERNSDFENKILVMRDKIIDGDIPWNVQLIQKAEDLIDFVS